MTIRDLIFRFIGVIELLVSIVVAFGVIIFVWGLISYLLNLSDPKKRSESLKYIFYGIVGLFVMVSLWGIVGIITGTFGLPNIVPLIRL